jgi:uncharacterized protein (DUF1800 family)
MSVSRRQFLRVGSGAALVAATGCGPVPDVIKGFYPPSTQRAEGPFQPPRAEAIDPISHVLNRLTFGPRPGDYERVRKLAREEASAASAFVEAQLQPEQIDDSVLEYRVRGFESLAEPVGELFEYKERYLLEEMTRATLLRAVQSERQLYEVMVQFWTDHFNIDSSKGDCRWLKAADDRDVIRAHALGKFPELLRASALSPAMLWYLDGRVNRKASDADKPNENYARELMELHTLGVHGGYSQKDVMEVARCLTGWTVRALKNGESQVGKVEFKPWAHDSGQKTVLGQVIPAIPAKTRQEEKERLGRAELERVLQIVSLHPSTAKHIATKLCARFIADDPPAGAVEAVASAFTRSQGDTRGTLRALFASAEFQMARGNKFKRPFNFIVSALRATNAETDTGRPLIEFLLRMGHAPFHYPTPDGYPEEASPWLGTLLWRWNFAVALSENKIKGTRIDPAALTKQFGGEAGLMAHLLGRQPTADETQSFHQSRAGLALILAAPAFQSC